MNKRNVFVVCAVLALAACETRQTSQAPVLSVPQNCGADKFQGLIGKPESAAEPARLPAGTRIIGPDDAITADFRPDRLNIEYDSNGKITDVSCY